MFQDMLAISNNGGGSDLYTMLSNSTWGEGNNGGSSASTQGFSATVGKHYLICATRSSTGSPQDVAIDSGATVETTLIDNVMSSTAASARVKLWVAIVTATATTITMAGTANVCVYLPLD